MADVIGRNAAMRHVDRIASMEGIDLDDDGVMEGAWR